jgi:hypothetical protein
MIVTCTPNPSLDRTFEVPVLGHGQVVRASKATLEPGGKGSNVSRALHANGHATRAVLPAGGHDGLQVCEALAALGIEVVGVPVAQPVRPNVSLIEPDATVTKINAPGPQLTSGECDALVKAVVDTLDDDPEGARFFADSLNLQAELNLAVLDRSGWSELTQVPYGIPFFSRGASIIFLPATLDGPIPDDYLAHHPNYSAASLAKIAMSGLDVTRIDVAGPGFVNLFLSDSWYRAVAAVALMDFAMTTLLDIMPSFTSRTHTMSMSAGPRPASGRQTPS